MGICQFLLAAQPTHNTPKPQDPLAELNSCLAATDKGVEASLDGAKLMTTCHMESILGSGRTYLTCERPPTPGIPTWWAHRARKGRDWEEKGQLGLAVMGAGRETKGEE